MANSNQQASTVPKPNYTLPIIAMFFLFAMISFVTNLAAPIGTIWGNKFEGNSVLGMMGNMMNFLAYLFMGIPAGNMLVRMGYKKTALWAMAIGVVGLFIQWLSSIVGANVMLTELVSLNFIIYLLGAFVCGFCVCMLNTVVNPMLNMLGGGGNKGNQLLQAGGSLNSLSGTLTPFFVGALIGVLTKETSMSVVAPLLWIAMGVFVVAFFIILFVTIPEPNLQKGGSKKPAYTHSPWNFRHTVLGVIGIFFYVGIEIGIPGTLNFYLSDTGVNGAEVAGAASLVAGVIVAIYWFFMLVGRTVSSTISGKVSTKAQMIVATSAAIIFIVVAIFTSRENKIEVPNFVYDPVQKTTQILVESDVPQNVIDNFMTTKDATVLSAHEATIKSRFGKTANDMVISLERPLVPISALFLVLCGLCTSVMWGGIFNLAVEGLGKYTAQASGIFMMMVVGGGIMPLIQSWLADTCGYMTSYWLVVAMLAYLLYYSLIGCRNVNKDIPVTEEPSLDEQLYL